MNYKTLLGSLAVACATSSFAGPAQRSDIAANPAWVIHIDVDALKPTTVGKYIMDRLTRPEANNKLAAFQAVFNFDPRSTLHGVSLYNMGQNPADGVMIVYADFDAARLVTLAKGAADYQSSEHRSRTIHNWQDKSKRTYAAIAGNRVLFGQKEGSVAAALDVLDGATGNLSGSKTFTEIGTPSSGKFLQVAGKKVPTGDNPNAAMFKLTDEVRMELGESNGQVNGMIALQTRNEEVAGHLNSIAQGLLSLMQLNKEKPVQARLADSVVLSHEGSIVLGTINLTANEVISGLKQWENRESERKARK